MHDNLPDHVHVTDVLKLLLMKQEPTCAAEATAIMPGLFAPELLAGRKMDLNRAFGNGRDDNGNGVVDEPQPAGARRRNVTVYTSAPATTSARSATPQAAATTPST